MGGYSGLYDSTVAATSYKSPEEYGGRSTNSLHSENSIELLLDKYCMHTGATKHHCMKCGKLYLKHTTWKHSMCNVCLDVEPARALSCKPKVYKVCVVCKSNFITTEDSARTICSKNCENTKAKRLSDLRNAHKRTSKSLSSFKKRDDWVLAMALEDTEVRKKESRTLFQFIELKRTNNPKTEGENDNEGT